MALNMIIDLAKQKVDDTIFYGIKVKDIPQLAEMIQAIKILEEYHLTCSCEDDTDHMKSPEWTIHRIESEIQAAEVYYNKWTETKQEAFKQIARDEIRHAEFLIKQAQEQGLDSSKVAELTHKLKTMQTKIA